MSSPKEQLIKSVQPLSNEVLKIFSCKTGKHFDSIDSAIEYIDTTLDEDSFEKFGSTIDAVNLIGLAVESINEDDPDYELFTKSIIKAAQASYADGLGKLFADALSESFKKQASPVFEIIKKDIVSRIAKSGGEARDINQGYAAKRQKIREAWASGKYSSRDICAEQECAALGMSFSAARKALRNTPDVT